MTTTVKDAILPRAIKVNRRQQANASEADKKSKERMRKVFIVV